MKKIILQMLLVIASIGFAQAQTKVTGKVVDVSGKPLDYVSVLVKEFRSAGAYTDEAGNYTINVPAVGQTLVFSVIGYVTQEVVIDSLSVINITMESDAVQFEDTIFIDVYGGRPAKKLFTISSSAAYAFPAFVSVPKHEKILTK